MPPAGSQPSMTANSRISSGAMTKFGIEMPVMARPPSPRGRCAVLAQRGDRAGGHAEQQRQQHRRAAEPQRDREAGRDQLGDV
jgi:hypothetical protein